ncbi:hypothetical protein ACO03_09260 [Pantoea ananatis]|nr:hypothetical protein ACO03_09260 [Pantoea ananatis]
MLIKLKKATTSEFIIPHALNNVYSLKGTTLHIKKVAYPDITLIKKRSLKNRNSRIFFMLDNKK